MTETLGNLLCVTTLTLGQISIVTLVLVFRLLGLADGA